MSGDGRPAPPPLACARCGAGLRPGRGDWSLVEIRAVADPHPPSFDPDDLDADAESAIRELLGRLRGMSERQLLEQVYSRRLHALCDRCFAEWSADPFGAGARG